MKNILESFCTITRINLVDKCGEQSDDTLMYLNHVIKESYKLGVNSSIKVIEDGNFLHDRSPEKKFSKEVCKSIQRELLE